MKKKEAWFQQWLDKENYKLWYQYGDNEVFKNQDKFIVWHPALGLRLMYPLDYYHVEHIIKWFIPHEIAKQEE